MRDAAGELSHGLHFLRAPKLLLDASPFGKVFGNHLRLSDRAVRAANSAAAHMDRDGFSVLSHPLAFPRADLARSPPFNVSLEIPLQQFLFGTVPEHSDDSRIRIENR